MAKSVEQQLAEAAAISARTTANRHPDHKNMQKIAAALEAKAKATR